MKGASRRQALRAICLASLAGWACGGGGGGGGGPTQPPPPQSGVTFTADSAATSNSVYLGSGSGGSQTIWVMSVNVQSVTDLYGVSLVVDYPRDLLSYVSGSPSEGSFLDGDGDFNTDLVVRERKAGKVTIGLSRLGVVPGADGSGQLLTIEFSTKAAGNGTISIEDEAAVDSLGVVQEDTTFIGGSVNVRVN